MKDFMDFHQTKIVLEDGNRVTVERISEADVHDVAKMYQEVAIDEHNYLDKLDPLSEFSFEKTGGMFLICNEDMLRTFCTSTTDLMLVARENDGEIKGIIWYSRNYNEFNLFKEVLLFPEMNRKQMWEEKLQNGQMIIGKEIIAYPKRSVVKLPLILFQTMLNHVKDCGYELSTGEVYRVCRTKTGEIQKKCDMLNIRSYKTLTRSGGIHVGMLPITEIALPWYSVWIESQVFIWNLQKVTVEI